MNDRDVAQMLSAKTDAQLETALKKGRETLALWDAFDATEDFGIGTDMHVSNNYVAAMEHQDQMLRAHLRVAMDDVRAEQVRRRSTLTDHTLAGERR